MLIYGRTCVWCSTPIVVCFHLSIPPMSSPLVNTSQDLSVAYRLCLLLLLSCTCVRAMYTSRAVSLSCTDNRTFTPASRRASRCASHACTFAPAYLFLLANICVVALLCNPFIIIVNLHPTVTSRSIRNSYSCLVFIHTGVYVCIYIYTYKLQPHSSCSNKSVDYTSGDTYYRSDNQGQYRATWFVESSRCVFFAFDLIINICARTRTLKNI